MNAVDPVGLLRSGFPEDEYNPEVRNPAQHIAPGEAPTDQLVTDVMIRWFGERNKISDAIIGAINAGLDGVVAAGLGSEVGDAHS